MRNKTTQGPKIRITLDLTPDLYDRLCELQRSSGAPSKAEVFRRSLAIYEIMASKAAAGYTFVAERGDDDDRIGILLL